MRSRPPAAASKMRRRTFRIPSAAAAGAPAALAYLLIGLFPLLLPAGLYHPQLWKGYVTVLLRTEEVPAGTAAALAVLPGLRGPRGTGLLSADTTLASFNDFDGMETVSLDRLPARLLPADPRHDPWLKALPLYFRAERDGAAWSVVYLRTRLNALLLGPGVRRAAARGGAASRLPEADPGAQAILAGLSAVFLLGLLAVRLRRGERALPLLAALPWLVNALSAGPPDLIAFFLLFPPLLRLLEERRESRPIRLARFALLWLGANLLLLSPHQPGGLLLRTGTAAALDLALMGLAGRLGRRGLLRTAHRPFAPLPILSSRYRHRPRIDLLQSARVGLTLLLLVLCLPLVLLEKRAAGLSIPAPEGAPRAQPVDWSSLERLHRREESARLPDLSDFAAHAAYQEGFPFGRPWRFPVAGERVTLTEYLQAGEGAPVVQTRRTLKRYPPEWLAGTLAQARAPSVERLLLDQGGAVAVYRETEAARLLRQLPPWRVPLAGLFLLLSVLARDFKLTDLPACGTHKRFARRKYPTP